MKDIILAIVSFIVLLSITMGTTYLFDYFKGGNEAREFIVVMLGCISFMCTILVPVRIIEAKPIANKWF